MTVEELFLVMSISGGLFFFISGYMIAYWKKSPASPQPETVPNEEYAKQLSFYKTEKEQLEKELTSLQDTYQTHKKLHSHYRKLYTAFQKLSADHKKIVTSYAQIHQQIKGITSENSSLKETITSLEETLRMKSQDSAAIEEVRARLQQTGDELQTVKKDFSVLQHDLETSRTENEELMRQKAAYENTIDALRRRNTDSQSLPTEEITSQEYTNELDALRQEKQELSDKLHECSDDLKTLQQQSESLIRLTDEKNELAIKVEVLSNQVGAMDELQKENEQLRAANEELAVLQEKVNMLESENDSYRAKGLAMSAAPRWNKVGTGNGVAKTAERLVQSLVSRDNNRGAVVADQLGLAVAGCAEQIDALAGVGGLFCSIDEKIHSLLPFGTLERFDCVDTNELHLSVFPVVLSKEKLMVTTISSGQQISTASFHELLAAIENKE